MYFLMGNYNRILTQMAFTIFHFCLYRSFFIWLVILLYIFRISQNEQWQFIEFVPFKCVIMYAFVGLCLQQRNIKVGFFVCVLVKLAALPINNWYFIQSVRFSKKKKITILLYWIGIFNNWLVRLLEIIFDHELFIWFIAFDVLERSKQKNREFSFASERICLRQHSFT